MKFHGLVCVRAPATSTWVNISMGLSGVEHFLELFRGATVHIMVISAMAGIIRLAFKRGGFVLSFICGASVALAGFLIVLAVAMSNI
jgi:hypothetical protein